MRIIWMHLMRTYRVPCKRKGVGRLYIQSQYFFYPLTTNANGMNAVAYQIILLLKPGQQLDKRGGDRLKHMCKLQTGFS